MSNFNFPSSSKCFMESQSQLPPVMSKDRVVLGPLTTTFDQAPGLCSTPLHIDFSNGTLFEFLGATCSGSYPAFQTLCWPPFSGTRLFTNFGLSVFYSPGLYCPSGFETSCLTTEGIDDGYSNFLFSLETGETAAACCPVQVLLARPPAQAPAPLPPKHRISIMYILLIGLSFLKWLYLSSRIPSVLQRCQHCCKRRCRLPRY